jgi:hypothetical protein
MSERAEREKQAIIQRYQQMMEEEKALLTKVAELNAQESEYRCARAGGVVGEAGAGPLGCSTWAWSAGRVGALSSLGGAVPLTRAT